jgi:hypothetical protein
LERAVPNTFMPINLPIEIWLEIYEFLGQKDILMLNKTSKLFPRVKLRLRVISSSNSDKALGNDEYYYDDGEIYVTPSDFYRLNLDKFIIVKDTSTTIQPGYLHCKLRDADLTSNLVLSPQTKALTITEIRKSTVIDAESLTYLRLETDGRLESESSISQSMIDHKHLKRFKVLDNYRFL